MEYSGDLPSDCPPADSDEITKDIVVFRIVKSNPATNDDFKSQREERPTAIFTVPECFARGVSVRTELTDSMELLKLPRLRGRAVCRVTLGAGSGSIKQTFKPSHHTWWRAAGFAMPDGCEVVAQ